MPPRAVWKIRPSGVVPYRLMWTPSLLRQVHLALAEHDRLRRAQRGVVETGEEGFQVLPPAAQRPDGSEEDPDLGRADHHPPIDTLGDGGVVHWMRSTDWPRGGPARWSRRGQPWPWWVAMSFLRWSMRCRVMLRRGALRRAFATDLGGVVLVVVAAQKPGQRGPATCTTTSWGGGELITVSLPARSVRTPDLRWPCPWRKSC
jgi:hypothetical protein